MFAITFPSKRLRENYIYIYVAWNRRSVNRFWIGGIPCPPAGHPAPALTSGDEDWSCARKALMRYVWGCHLVTGNHWDWYCANNLYDQWGMFNAPRVHLLYPLSNGVLLLDCQNQSPTQNRQDSEDSWWFRPEQFALLVFIAFFAFFWCPSSKNKNLCCLCFCFGHICLCNHQCPKTRTHFVCFRLLFTKKHTPCAVVGVLWFKAA